VTAGLERDFCRYVGVTADCGAAVGAGGAAPIGIGARQAHDTVPFDDTLTLSYDTI
jgi:hypothetical protein